MKMEDIEIGRKVVYRAYRPCDVEEGVVTSVNDRHVFARYGNDVNSKATNPKQLEYID